MANSWGDSVAGYLLDAKHCPRCNTELSQPGKCLRCGADLSGAEAIEVWRLSESVVELVRERQRLVDALPTLELPKAALQPAAPLVSSAAPTDRPSSQVSIQSVLAVAGAGLFAVAAIVFTFFNPDLTNFATRTVIIGAVTAVFAGATWLFARRGLGFSSEAMGGLTAVFVALDVWAFSEGTKTALDSWAAAGIGAGVASGALLALAVLWRVRTWLWVAGVGFALTPWLFAQSLDGVWVPAIGFVAVATVALGVHALLNRLSARFSSPLRADHATATIIELVAFAAAGLALVGVAESDIASRVLPTSAVLAALAVIAALTAKYQLPRLASFGAGTLFVTAVALLPIATGPDNPDFVPALFPAAAVVGVAIVSLVGRWRRMSPAAARAGAAMVLVVSALPAAVLSLVQVLASVLRLAPTGFEGEALPRDLGLAAALGLASVAAGGLVLSVTDRWLKRTGTAAQGHVFAAGATWYFVAALASFVTWNGLLVSAQAILALVSSIAIVLVLVRVPRVAVVGLGVRIPLVVGIHSLLILAAIISWPDTSLRVPIGAAVVAAVWVAAHSVPSGARFLHTGFGYAFALAVVAGGLSLTTLEPIAVLCLTTSVGAIAALVATLTPLLKTRSWYAVLLVTSVPFVIGVVTVAIERSGWTALSTGLIFVLLLALVATRRAGLTRVLRTGAAALLVPSLAVVVICLGAQVLDISASPVTLPVIAILVGAVLPATTLIGSALVKRGISATDARAVRIAIEASSLFTGAVAVALALWRAAAGIPTTFLVLVILGTGAIATAVFAKRRYAWVVAGASFTGALWCVLALSDVQVAEPYILPPALATAIVGSVLVLRGRSDASALALVAAGLGFAVVPSLAILAVAGNGSASLTPWRTLGILAGGAVLVVLAALAARLGRTQRLPRAAALVTPLAIFAIVAAAAGAVQGVRYGLGIDEVWLGGPNAVMIVALILSATAVLISALSGGLLTRLPAGDRGRFAASRWVFAPAVAYLVAGPIASVGPSWFAIGTLVALTVALLAFMIVIAVRQRTFATSLPPVWFVFAVAWFTAVAGWSERELRVEAFSLPLGLALLAVGIISMRPGSREVDSASLNSWPVGFTGSWRVLGPGILVTLIPSILATGTDPRTERAILVIGLALVAILAGNSRRLAAPFILGIIVLPIENVIVLAGQVGSSIGAVPWWITLATAGAVLLVIAVSTERRNRSESDGVGRLRDLK